MGAHYLDPPIPGSLRSEILPTRRYIESIWKRPARYLDHR